MKKILILFLVMLVVGITPSAAVEINELSDLNATMVKNTKNNTNNDDKPVNELEDLGAILVNPKKNNTIPRPVNELEDLGAILLNSKTNKTYDELEKELEELEAVPLNHTEDDSSFVETGNDSSVNKFDNPMEDTLAKAGKIASIVIAVIGAVASIGAFFNYWSRIWGIVRYITTGWTRYHGYSLSTDGRLPGNFFMEHYVDQTPEMGKFIGIGGFLRHGTFFRSAVTDRYPNACFRGYSFISDWWSRTQFRSPFMWRSPFTPASIQYKPLLANEYPY